MQTTENGVYFGVIEVVDILSLGEEVGKEESER